MWSSCALQFWSGLKQQRDTFSASSVGWRVLAPRVLSDAEASSACQMCGSCQTCGSFLIYLFPNNMIDCGPGHSWLPESDHPHDWWGHIKMGAYSSNGTAVLVWSADFGHIIVVFKTFIFSFLTISCANESHFFTETNEQWSGNQHFQ